MRRAASAGVLCCSLMVLLLGGCGEDAPTAAVPADAAPGLTKPPADGGLGAITNAAGFITFIK